MPNSPSPSLPASPTLAAAVALALAASLSGCIRIAGNDSATAASAPASGVVDAAQASAEAAASTASAAATVAMAAASAASAGSLLVATANGAMGPATNAQRAAGEQLSRQGAGATVPACSGCHGLRGEGNAAAGFPRLAGQSSAYLAHALASYGDDTRRNPVMQPIAKAMDAGQRQAAAAWFASLAPSAAPPATAMAAASSPAGDLKRGRQLADVGEAARNVAACASCHGPDGAGTSAAIPALSGQPAAFLVTALQAWRDGSRDSDPDHRMPAIAKGLDDIDVAAAAAYYASLPVPGQAWDARPAGSLPVTAPGPASAASR